MIPSDSSKSASNTTYPSRKPIALSPTVNGFLDYVLTPSQPYLVSMYTNQTAYTPSYSAAVKNGDRDSSTNTFPAKIDEILKIVLQNIGAHAIDNETGGALDVHPWHAHGEHYYDIGGGPGTFDPNVAEERLKDTEPVLRDTTMLFCYNATTQPDERQGQRLQGRKTGCQEADGDFGRRPEGWRGISIGSAF